MIVSHEGKIVTPCTRTMGKKEHICKLIVVRSPVYLEKYSIPASSPPKKKKKNPLIIQVPCNVTRGTSFKQILMLRSLHPLICISFCKPICWCLWCLLSLQEEEEREKVLSNPDAIIPAAFVSFKTRWGAAVCAQTQQSSNPTIWLTEWAPEPRDIFWDNLAIPYVKLAVRKLIMAVALFFLTFCFMIPIAFVQSLANIEGIEKVFPFLKPIIEK